MSLPYCLFLKMKCPGKDTAYSLGKHKMELI